MAWWGPPKIDQRQTSQKTSFADRGEISPYFRGTGLVSGGTVLKHAPLIVSGFFHTAFQWVNSRLGDESEEKGVKERRM